MTLPEKLIDKSKEAFLLAIEIYNKPSIRYRVEGFGFFACNAWELMLKAHLINSRGNDSIYYKDNPKRTLSLERCIELVFTNNKDPLRINLERIIDLRNTSTHFIVEEYEMVYIPLFQACVFNYIEKMRDFHGIDIEDSLPRHFLSLSVNMNQVSDDDIRAKYPAEIADKLIAEAASIRPLIEDNNHRFAIRVDHHFYITKDKNKATATVAIDKNADTNVIVLQEIKDPNVTHKYNAGACCDEINKRLAKVKIDIKFNRSNFNSFVKYYQIKDNPIFCYTSNLNSSPVYGYSLRTVDFIVDEIKKDPEHIIQNIRDQLKTKGS